MIKTNSKTGKQWKWTESQEENSNRKKDVIKSIFTFASGSEDELEQLSFQNPLGITKVSQQSAAHF